MGDRQAVEVSYSADIDVQQAVVIDIDYGDARRPAIVFRYPGFSGDIFEVQAAFVQIETVRSLVGCEEQVDLAIVVEIARTHSAAVVIVHIIEDIEISGGVQRITEVEAGLLFVHHLEGRILYLRVISASRDEGEYAEEVDSKSSG